MWRLPNMSPETQSALCKSFVTAFWLSCTFYSNSAFADIPNLQTMITNFATDVPNLMRLVTAGAYVLGLFFVIAAIMRMKHLGEMRTMMNREHGFFGPLMELLVGGALLYLPSTVQTVTSTFWQSATPYAYLQNTASSAVFVNACYTVIQLIGTVSFIRGLLILQQAGGESRGQHVIGKAMSHLIGGVLCINIYGTLQTLEKTVGMIT